VKLFTLKIWLKLFFTTLQIAVTSSRFVAMGVGRGGLGPPWILKFSAKKACFLNFEWEKQIHHF